MTIEAQVTINSDTATVWKVITDIRRSGKILSTVENIEIVHEPANGLTGLKWRETRLFFGKPATIEKWITDASENKFYTTRAEMEGFIFLTRFTISGSGANTTLQSSHETQSRGLLAKIKSLPMVFFRGVLKKAILKDLNEIKAAVEQP